eukprot:1158765-Pelagomonas_calceolata.AAC.4
MGGCKQAPERPAASGPAYFDQSVNHSTVIHMKIENDNDNHELVEARPQAGLWGPATALVLTFYVPAFPGSCRKNCRPVWGAPERSSPGIVRQLPSPHPVHVSHAHPAHHGACQVGLKASRQNSPFVHVVFDTLAPAVHSSCLSSRCGSWQ